MTVLGIDLWAFAALGLVVVISAAIHRLSGQGFGTLFAPFMTLIAPDFVPASVLILGALVTALGAGTGLSGIRPKEIAYAAFGRLLGTLPAILVVGVIAGSVYLGPAVGAMILFGVALSLAGLSVPKTPMTLMVAGWLSGFIGTLTSVGAAPLGLIYQNDKAKSARSTLNAFFLFGVSFSIASLAIAGLVTSAHVALAAALSPFVFAGFALATPLSRRTENLPLKPAALSLAAVGAVVLILKALW
ncbi:MAG: TSUP family transporter [Paracoccaceae bacterium]